MMRSIAIAIVAAIAFEAPSGRADTPAVGPYVYSYNGPASAYEIQRSEQPIPLTPYLLLLPNDRVRVVVATNKLPNEPKNYIVLRIASHDVTLYEKDPPYCVGAPQGNCKVRAPDVPNQDFWRVRVILGNIMASAGALLARAHQDQYTDMTESTVSRGAPSTTLRASIPMLEQTPQRLASGKRALAIAWQSCYSPCEVRLYRDGHKDPLERLKVSDSAEARFPAVSFVEGTYYRIVIGNDATDVTERTSVRFLVVAPGALPKLPAAQVEALADPAVPADLRATLEATLLVQNNKAWGLEAYQRIAPIADAYRPAGLLHYQLVNGL